MDTNTPNKPHTLSPNPDRLAFSVSYIPLLDTSLLQLTQATLRYIHLLFSHPLCNFCHWCSPHTILVVLQMRAKLGKIIFAN